VFIKAFVDVYLNCSDVKGNRRAVGQVCW